MGEAARAITGAGFLPHRRVEAWRWSSLNDQDFGPGAPQAAPDPFEGTDAIMVGDGTLGDVAPGVRVFRVEAPNPPAWTNDLAMARLAVEHCPSVLMVEISAELDRPLQIAPTQAVTDGQIAHRRVAIVVRDGASATLLETAHSAGGLANTLVDIGVGKAARLDRIIVQSASGTGGVVYTSGLHLKERAQVRQTSIVFGSATRARVETHAFHPGADAHLDLNGVCLALSAVHGDQTTHVHHTGPDGDTRETFRTIASQGGKAVFQGKIHVDRAAQKTDARMAHDALLLDDMAEVKAKPELEIYADDVQCAHGNTVGSLDADALFYMLQRGLPRARAMELMMQAFLDPALAAVPDGALKDGLTDRVHGAIRTNP